MNILIVHDRQEVSTEIVKLCEEACPQGTVICVAPDYVSAREQLSVTLFDLAIIDLTIPHIVGKFPATYETAAALLSDIIDVDGINAPGDVVGISRDSKTLALIKTDIGPHLMAVVEETVDGLWKRQLSDRIQYVLKSGAARQRSYNTHYDFDVCVLTALDEEMAPYIDLFSMRPALRVRGAIEFPFRDKSGVMRSGVACAIGRAGSARAAAKAEVLLSAYKPKFLLMSGFCGGVQGKAKPGDVAIFETVFDWDSGKWRSEGGASVFYSRPEPISIRDTDIHFLAREMASEGVVGWEAEFARAKELSPAFQGDGRMLLVPAASGSAVIAHEDIIEKIRGLNEAIAVIDMESYGLYLAATTTAVRKPNVLCVKAVADMCDPNKGDDLHAACSYLSAKTLYNLICKRLMY